MTGPAPGVGAGPGGLLDAGLQPERTALAWRRTALAVTVGGLVALRVLAPPLGAWGLAAGLGGTASGLVLALLGARRARAVAGGLRRPGRGPVVVPAAGGPLAALALVVTVGAGVCLVGVLALATAR